MAWYRFDSGGGSTVHDRSGNGDDGTLKGDPEWVDGWLGDGALKFDGSGDYVAIQNLHYESGDSLPEFTVVARYRSTVGGQGRFNNWSFWDFDRSEWFNVYLRGDDGKLGFSGTDGVNDPFDIRANTPSNDGDGHQGTVVYDSSNDFVKFYLDGSPDGTVTYADVAPISDTTTRYGFVGDGSEASSFDGNRNNQYFEGTIDEVRFYDRVLSPGEVKMLAGGGGVVARTTEVTVSPG